jgi:hypothetical protein
MQVVLQLRISALKLPREMDGSEKGHQPLHVRWIGKGGRAKTNQYSAAMQKERARAEEPKELENDLDKKNFHVRRRHAFHGVPYLGIYLGTSCATRRAPTNEAQITQGWGRGRPNLETEDWDGSCRRGIFDMTSTGTGEVPLLC